MGEKVDIEGFKELILKMYDGFPNAIHFNKVEKTVISSELRDRLVEKDYLINETHIDINNKSYIGYMLGC